MGGALLSVRGRGLTFSGSQSIFWIKLGFTICNKRTLGKLQLCIPNSYHALFFSHFCTIYWYQFLFSRSVTKLTLSFFIIGHKEEGDKTSGTFLKSGRGPFVSAVKGVDIFRFSINLFPQINCFLTPSNKSFIAVYVHTQPEKSKAKIKLSWESKLGQ